MHIFLIFMNEISHILMYKCIHKTIDHTQTPKIPRTFTYEPVWESSNHHIQKFANFVNLTKHLEKKPILCFMSLCRSQTLPVALSGMYTTPNRRPPATTDALRSASVTQRRHGRDYDVMLDAYYVDSYLQKDAFLLTQTPVTLQFLQFWDILYNSRTV